MSLLLFFFSSAIFFYSTSLPVGDRIENDQEVFGIVEVFICLSSWTMLFSGVNLFYAVVLLVTNLGIER